MQVDFRIHVIQTAACLTLSSVFPNHSKDEFIKAEATNRPEKARDIVRRHLQPTPDNVSIPTKKPTTSNKSWVKNSILTPFQAGFSA